MPVRQVPPAKHFPSGDSRALLMLRMSPEELDQRYGLTFDEDCDDLDSFKLAAIELSDGSQAWLLRHRGNPEPGTTVYVDAEADLVRSKKLVLRTLGLTDDDPSWMTPFIDAPPIAAKA